MVYAPLQFPTDLDTQIRGHHSKGCLIKVPILWLCSAISIRGRKQIALCWNFLGHLWVNTVCTFVHVFDHTTWREKGFAANCATDQQFSVNCVCVFPLRDTTPFDASTDSLQSGSKQCFGVFYDYHRSNVVTDLPVYFTFFSRILHFNAYNTSLFCLLSPKKERKKKPPTKTDRVSKIKKKSLHLIWKVWFSQQQSTDTLLKEQRNKKHCAQHEHIVSYMQSTLLTLCRAVPQL